MNVNFMRFVDRWIGIPICIILSIFNNITGVFKSKKQRSIKKILFIQISEMGSAISAYSSLIKVKDLYPDSEIFYFIFREMQESIKLLNVLPEENILSISSKSLFKFIFGVLKMIWKIRRMKFDVILDLELFSRISSILSYLFNGKIRVGFNGFYMEGLYRGNLHTHKVIYNHLKHISKNFLSLVYSIDSDTNEFPLVKKEINDNDICVKKIQSTFEGKNNIYKKLKEINPKINEKNYIVIINPNASGILPLRRWPIENYIKLAKKLIINKSIYVVITGIKSELREAEQIVNSINNKNIINLTGKTTLKELIDLYNISDILVSNDSGPPNFASLTNIKVFVFFGPETPICYKPLGNNITALYSNFFCSPCVSAYNHRKSPCKNNKCLKAISVDEVYNLVKRDIIKIKR
jgi:ADP-heptose:LPS heptosyltransferase